ncbi:MAG TPA: response regulator [Methylibium sp.]|nr:response regulator [Methylibium sp.]
MSADSPGRGGASAGVGRPMRETADSVVEAQRRAEQALAESRRTLDASAAELAVSRSMLEAVLASSDDAVVVLDVRHRVLAVNPAFSALWGLAPPPAARREFAGLLVELAPQVLDPAAFAGQALLWEHTLDSGCATHVMLRDGRTLVQRIEPLRLQERRVGVVVRWRLATAELAAASAVQRSTAALFARISHELRTPLNAILGFAQVLGRDAEQRLKPTQRRQLDYIDAAGRRLLGQIDELLALSRHGSADRPQRLERCDAVALALGAAGAAAQADPAGAAQAWVRADPGRLTEALRHLLPRLDRPDSPPATGLQLHAERAGSHWHLTFGASAGGGRRRREAQVEGVGFAIAGHWIEQMGGRLTLWSLPDGRRELELELPAAEPADERTVGPAATGGRVLYIDDDEVNRVLMQALFARWPAVELALAHDGASGIVSALRERPALVLIDMMLPDIDGLAVLRALRAQPEGAALPCIAVSANALPEDIDTALAAGFDAYLTKPVAEALLHAEVERFLHPRTG